MRVRELHIHRVRNLQDVHLQLGPGLNLFLGPNGAGKTAILEGLHLLARGRSFRSPKLSDVLNHDSTDLLVRGEFELFGNATKPEVLRAGLAKKARGATELKINGAQEGRLSTLARRIPLQLMLPSASDLVFGGPVLRRQFLNWGVFHVEHQYGALWQQFSKVLRQRNALLKAAPSNQVYSGSEIQSWTERMVEVGLQVTACRERYMQAWTPELNQALDRLGLAVAPNGNHSPLPIVAKFDCGIPGLPSSDLEPTNTTNDASIGAEVDPQLAAIYTNLLSENFRREVKYGSTQSGPHRADIRLLVGQSAANSTLSRGQAKSLALGMMVSQAQHLMSLSGESSVFLIDDVGAELDARNNERFFGVLGAMGCQILATTNEMPSFAASSSGVGAKALQEMKVFHVEHGVVTAD